MRNNASTETFGGSWFPALMPRGLAPRAAFSDVACATFMQVLFFQANEVIE